MIPDVASRQHTSHLCTRTTTIYCVRAIPIQLTIIVRRFGVCTCASHDVTQCKYHARDTGQTAPGRQLCHAQHRRPHVTTAVSSQTVRQSRTCTSLSCVKPNKVGVHWCKDRESRGLSKFLGRTSENEFVWFTLNSTSCFAKCLRCPWARWAGSFKFIQSDVNIMKLCNISGRHVQ